MNLQLAVPYRSPGEYQAWLRGVRDVAQVLELPVDADAFGGGIPNFLTLTVPDEDVGEAVTDTAAVPDSPGPAPDSEPEPPPGRGTLES